MDSVASLLAMFENVVKSVDEMAAVSDVFKPVVGVDDEISFAVDAEDNVTSDEVTDVSLVDAKFSVRVV